MRFTPTWQRCLLAVGAFLLSPVAGEDVLYSSSLNSCQKSSLFSASVFDVVYTPKNDSVAIKIDAKSAITGYVNVTIQVYAYGHPVITKIINPCGLDVKGFCPMEASKFPDAPFNINLGKDSRDQIPGIAFTMPDLDLTARVYITDSKTKDSLACLEATISNGKTVDLVGVKWATAICAGLILLASVIIHAMGHHNAATHIAANFLALFSYFQSQLFVGLSSVHLPPMAASWAQNFQWSMGIIRVDFLQNIITWYQRATGGSPATLFDPGRSLSIQVQKRSLDSFTSSSTDGLIRRDNILVTPGKYLVYGIQRVAYRAKIETTNVFLTGLVFFVLAMVFAMLLVAICKGIYELLVSRKVIGANDHLGLSKDWTVVLKGIVYRTCLLGFPAVCTLGLWEFTQRDSPAAVVLAAFFLVGILGLLGKAAVNIISLGSKSVAEYNNPAFILFSDPQILNKLGFLYIPFKASAYYFIAPALIYIFIKSLLIAVAQPAPVAQAIGFVVVEIIAIIGAAIIRPWMDKPTNSFNIAILVVSFLNAVFMLIFSDIFGAPPIVAGVVGVVFFCLNAGFSLVLLIMLIVSATLCFFRKNPDARYPYMADDRVSFIRSQTQVDKANELSLLAATARGNAPSRYMQLNGSDISLRPETKY
ncbi:hypothetical protein VHEMI01197 [[Torrubiella] hemipterigena]|uniref:ML-like domain-containing protein n=1 Tax=[Torrubiella] hemipterigena TaxID=1531966 RepID=A0A0A1T4M0_9HYPO|nr:hypothetical protein VHEMI01197 [[Torrubiella] hemipterigena]